MINNTLTKDYLYLILICVQLRFPNSHVRFFEYGTTHTHSSISNQRHCKTINCSCILYVSKKKHAMISQVKIRA